MGIFSSISKLFSSQSHNISKSNFGNNFVKASEKICPMCKVSLLKEVKAKTKCKHCGKFIYRRTHPYTNEGLTLTKDQADVVDLEWAKINGTYEVLVQEKDEFESMKSDLSKKFGKVPNDNDVQWALQNERLAKAMETANWGVMSGCYLKMGVICFKEKKYKACVINYSLCGNCATREYYLENRRLGMEVDNKYLKNYHYLDSTPVRDSLLKLGLVEQLDKLISIVQNMKLQPGEVVEQVEAILNV